MSTTKSKTSKTVKAAPTAQATAPQLPLFYKKVVPLNKEQHSKLYIEPVEGYAFAKETNSLYVAAAEFPRVAGEYPIVFGSDASSSVFPVALLGLKANQNLFVNGNGQWSAAYIPAYARRYPFILAMPDPKVEQFTVCIDEGYSGFNTANEGQALFDESGEQAAVLNQAVDFLKDYQSHVQLTTLFCKNLVDLDLLEPMQANVEMKTGDKYAIAGFSCINRQKLKALSADKLAGLVKSDQLELIYSHLMSLKNVNSLISKLK